MCKAERWPHWHRSDWFDSSRPPPPSRRNGELFYAVSMVFLSRRGQRTSRVYDDRCIGIVENETKTLFASIIPVNDRLAVAYGWADQLRVRADRDTMPLCPVDFKSDYIRSSPPQKSPWFPHHSSWIDRKRVSCQNEIVFVYDLSNRHERSGYQNGLAKPPFVHTRI